MASTSACIRQHLRFCRGTRIDLRAVVSRRAHLSIHEIFTPRREWFYWAAILCTFALGTAAGDLATEALGLGFTWGAVAFGTLIAITYAAGAWAATPC